MHQYGSMSFEPKSINIKSRKSTRSTRAFNDFAVFLLVTSVHGDISKQA